MYDDIRHNNQGAFALTQSMKHCKDEFKFMLRGTRVKGKTDKPYILKPKDYCIQMVLIYLSALQIEIDKTYS